MPAWPHPPHELPATNVYELSGHYQTNNLHQFHISYQLQLQLQTCTNCPMLRSTQRNGTSEADQELTAPSIIILVYFLEN